MDYDGKGLILKENFYLALPDLTQHVSEEQVEDFFKAERIFQAPPYHTLDLAHFMRIFFQQSCSRKVACHDLDPPVSG